MSVVSSDSDSQKNNDEKNKIIHNNFLIYLTIITEIIPKNENDEEKCICHNSIQPDSTNQKNIFTEVEIIPSCKVPVLIGEREKIENTKKDTPNTEAESQKTIQIKLVDLCNSLRLIGYPITGSMINIYLKEVEDYVFFGADPVDSNVYIDSTQVDMNCIKIKIINYLDERLVKKNKDQKENEEFENEDEEEEVVNINQGNQSNQGNQGKKEKRTKERKIGFIIEKVNAWRKLYNGFYNENGEHTRYSLDQAAKIIKISKKSLDDYLLQLRLGRKHGFDFNEHRNARVGELRAFVKKMRNGQEK